MKRIVTTTVMAGIWSCLTALALEDFSWFAIFNYATKETGGHVDVEKFCYSKTDS